MIIIGSGILIVPLLLHLLIRIFKWARSTKAKTISGLLLGVAFIAYIYVVIGLLYFPIEIGVRSNFIPSIRINLLPFVETIKTLSDSLKAGILAESAMPIIGNLLMFVPLPIFLTIKYPQKFRRNTIISFAASLSAEMIQAVLVLIGLVNYRVIDIDDSIFNFLGMFVAWLLIRRRYRKSSKYNAVGDPC